MELLVSLSVRQAREVGHACRRIPKLSLLRADDTTEFCGHLSIPRPEYFKVEDSVFGVQVRSSSTESATSGLQGRLLALNRGKEICAGNVEAF